MITAVDTNVLFDIFWEDAEFVEQSEAALRSCLREGRVVACEVVWAELAGAFPSDDAFRLAMETLGVWFSPIGLEATLAAGNIWRAYRARGGTRDRLLADFLVHGHALHHADRLLTRDRGFERSHMPNLLIVDPARPTG